MSLDAPLAYIIPDETARVAHAAFPKGNPYMRVRDTLGPLFTNPDFAALGAAFGAWTGRVETTAEFASALDEANGRKGLRLLHCLTDIEQLSAAGATVSALRSEG